MCSRNGSMFLSVEDKDVIDIIGIDSAGNVVLTVTDHLDWSNTLEHVFILQEKINRYLAFVESGEILETYPKATGRQIHFKIDLLHRPDEEGSRLLDRIKHTVVRAGFPLQIEVVKQPQNS